jgi:hypothetical protein
MAEGLHVLWLKVCSMDESIFCARMCISSNTNEEKKKKNPPWKKGQVVSSFCGEGGRSPGK